MMLYISEPYLKARIRKFVGGQRWGTILVSVIGERTTLPQVDIKQTPSLRKLGEISMVFSL
jgi:hypothetical protein